MRLERISAKEAEHLEDVVSDGRLHAGLLPVGDLYPDFFALKETHQQMRATLLKAAALEGWPNIGMLRSERDWRWYCSLNHLTRWELICAMDSINEVRNIPLKHR